MSVLTSATNFDRVLLQLVSINELVKQIILYRRQNGLSAWNDVSKLWLVSDSVPA